MAINKQLPAFVLFGDSLTQWSFDDTTEGFGWDLEQRYQDKVQIVNEGQAGYTSQLLQRDFQRIIKSATAPEATPTLLFTIFLGANDACFVGPHEYVPLPQFEENIRHFVETILFQEHLANTKIILITPPPINIPEPELSDDEEEEADLEPTAAAALAAARGDPKQGRGYRTYMSKKRYADKIMEIAESYEDSGRVAGLNFWKALIDAALDDQNRLGDEDAYHEDRLPGCGLKWAGQFKAGYFTDGLHLAKRGYSILSKSLLEVMLNNWPELAPERIPN